MDNDYVKHVAKYSEMQTVEFMLHGERPNIMTYLRKNGINMTFDEVVDKVKSEDVKFKL